MGEKKRITSTDIKLALKDVHSGRNTYFVIVTGLVTLILGYLAASIGLK